MNRPLDQFSCEETFRRLDDYVDRQLSPEDLRAIEDHLRLCDMCSREFVFEAGILHGVREKLGRLDAPPDLLARISARIARAAGETAGG
jgi:anti-sigma factor (TIGR02949 family)